MNPYYPNWSYGYTLAPATEQTRGAYTMYGQGQQAQAQQTQPAQHGHGANQSNLANINAQESPNNSWSSNYKSNYNNSAGKSQSFVTSSNTTLKQEVEQSQLIGPVKPSQVPASTQLDPTKALQKLHELAISNKLVERYEKVQEAVPGDPNRTECIVKLFIGTETYEGRHENIKLAKQNAAVQALASTKYQTAKEKKLTMFNTAKRIGVTATSELHEIAAKKGVQVDFKFLEPYNFEFKHSMRMWNKKDMLGNYRVQLNVAGYGQLYEFYGQAELPQQAKHNASTQALEVIRGMPDPSGAGKVVAKPGGVDSEDSIAVNNGDNSSSVSKSGGAAKNTTMLLNEIAISNSCTPEWVLISETGPAHARLYTWQLTIGEFSTEGTGPSKKMARQGAADRMLATLPEEWMKRAQRSVNSHAARFGKRKYNSARGPPNKKMTPGGDGTVSEKLCITANNPISCLHEYSKKKKIDDPCFEVVSESVLDNIQKGSLSFKKIEYTMQLHMDGRRYSASAQNKKAAKQACALEAWDYIKQTM